MTCCRAPHSPLPPRQRVKALAIAGAFSFAGHHITHDTVRNPRNPPGAGNSGGGNLFGCAKRTLAKPRRGEDQTWRSPMATAAPSTALTQDDHSAQLRKAVIASTIGTTIEWYDFFLYGT